MTHLSRIFPSLLVVLVGLFLVGGGPLAEIADAKAKFGGKSFRSAPKAPAKKAAPATAQTQKKSGGSFGKGLMGGLLGGAIGGMLFGSMFGMGGEGMGLLPILLLAGVGWFLYRKFTQQAQQRGYSQQGAGGGFQGQQGGFSQPMQGSAPMDAPPPTPGSPMAVEAGLDEIRQSDPGFDPEYFMEVASDVFFKVQAGWMRREIESFQHLLGEQLAKEYADHFADMRARGVINKLESIAVRNISIQKAGSTGTEDYVTVLFTANLLDYTVNDADGSLVEGSMTEPVKFKEEWTWARPVGTQEWRLEGIHEPV